MTTSVYSLSEEDVCAAWSGSKDEEVSGYLQVVLPQVCLRILPARPALAAARLAALAFRAPGLGGLGGGLRLPDLL